MTDPAVEAAQRAWEGWDWSDDQSISVLVDSAARDWKFTNEYYGHDEHVAVEVDKAPGGLTRESDTCRDGVGNVVRVWDRWTSGWTVTK